MSGLDVAGILDALGYIEPIEDLDDSELKHYSKGYDPVKAKEYYERTKKLKGRRRGTALVPAGRRPGQGGTTLVAPGAKPPKSKQQRRREQLEREKAALEKRLDRLREVLREAVDRAQKKSGGRKPEKRSESKDSKESKDTKSSTKSKDSKDRKELTRAEKDKKNREAREEYKKDSLGSLSQDVEVLREQVKEIQGKIQRALNDARKQAKKPARAGETRLAQPSRTRLEPSAPRGR